MKNLAENVALSQYTSWLVGGYAEYFILPQTIRELQEAQTWAQDKKLPITILGGGSNVLISDQGIKGLVISLRNLKGAVVTEDPPKLKNLGIVRHYQIGAS